MTPRQALGFIRTHGVVLASAIGPVPRLAEAVAGAPIKGSWWAHPKGKEIYRILRAVDQSPEVLSCRLVGGKVTFVHRRLWPALVRVAGKFPARNLAWAREEHTASGHHVTREVPFPKWVPKEIVRQAGRLDQREALEALGTWAANPRRSRRRAVVRQA